jgi:hypothetical protein
MTRSKRTVSELAASLVIERIIRNKRAVPIRRSDQIVSDGYDCPTAENLDSKQPGVRLPGCARLPIRRETDHRPPRCLGQDEFTRIENVFRVPSFL